MKLALSVLTLISVGFLTTANAKMAQRLPAKSQKQQAQEFKTPSHIETVHTADGVFDVRLKPSIPSFDYEQALRDSERKTKVAQVKRPQLVTGARKPQKRSIASVNEPKIKLYRTKKRSR